MAYKYINKTRICSSLLGNIREGGKRVQKIIERQEMDEKARFQERRRYRMTHNNVNNFSEFLLGLLQGKMLQRRLV